MSSQQPPSSESSWGAHASGQPGSASLLALVGADASSLTGAELVDAIVASEKALSLLTGLQMRFMAALAEPFAAGDPMRLAARIARKSCTTGDDDPDHVRLFVPEAATCLAAAEIAAALRIAPVTAGIRVREAASMTEELAPTLNALEQGLVDRGKARVIIEHCHPLSHEHTEILQSMVLPKADQLTTSELRELAGQSVIIVDPDGAQERHEAAAARRELTLRPQSDAMATLSAYLPADGAVKIFHISDLLATSTAGTPTDSRGVGARRIDALIDIADQLLTHGYLDITDYIDNPLPDHSTPGRASSEQATMDHPVPRHCETPESATGSAPDSDSDSNMSCDLASGNPAPDDTTSHDAASDSVSSPQAPADPTAHNRAGHDPATPNTPRCPPVDRTADEAAPRTSIRPSPLDTGPGGETSSVVGATALDDTVLNDTVLNRVGYESVDCGTSDLPAVDAASGFGGASGFEGASDDLAAGNGFVVDDLGSVTDRPRAATHSAPARSAGPQEPDPREQADPSGHTWSADLTAGHTTNPTDRSRRALSRQGRRPHLSVVIGLGTLGGHDQLPAMLSGFGAIPAGLGRAIAQSAGTVTALFADTASGMITEAGALTYRPSQQLRDKIAALIPTCQFPSCRQPTWRCDIDHREAFNHADPEHGGRTDSDNAGPFCRRHHLMKHHSEWSVRVRPERFTLEWTSPTGHRYVKQARPALHSESPELHSESKGVIGLAVQTPGTALVERLERLDLMTVTSDTVVNNLQTNDSPTNDSGTNYSPTGRAMPVGSVIEENLTMLLIRHHLNQRPLEYDRPATAWDTPVTDGSEDLGDDQGDGGPDDEPPF